MNRGLYGQAEGNEKRNNTDVFADHLRANEIAEGEWLAQMEKHAKKGDMQGMAVLRDRMKTVYVRAGVPAALAQQRADTVLSQGSRFLKV
jgi:hypothetical protein